MASRSPQIATERQLLIAALEKSRDRYLKTVSSLDASCCEAKLNDDSWTILQIAEHVAVAEHGMLRALELATEKTTPANYELDQKIIAGGTNRAVKRRSPERALPKGRWASLAECISAFEVARAKSIETIRTASDLRGKAAQHPLLGELDGHQLALVMAGHAERHALQMEEIQNSEAYKSAAAK